MADSQPLVCASLHLPPDIQPFLRIHQVGFEIFLPNLDRLRLTLEATRDVCPEAAAIFFETRKILRQQLENVFLVLYTGQVLAEQYLELLEAVSERKPTQDPLHGVYFRASGGVRSSREAQEAMTRFRNELEGAIGRISTAMSAKNERGSKVSLFSPENTRLVLEIIGGVDECNALLQQCHNQFENLRKRTQNKDSIESNPPSGEEIQVIRTKWQTLFDNINGLSSHGHVIAQEIQLPSRDNIEDTSGKRKRGHNIPLWRSLLQHEAKPGAIHAANAAKLLGLLSDLAAAVATHLTSYRALQTSGVDQASEADAAKGLRSSMTLDVSGTSQTTTLNRTTSKSPKISSWWKNSLRTSPQKEVSERLDVTSGGAPRPPFWRTSFRHTTCLSTKRF